MCRLLGFKTKTTRLLEKPLYYLLRASRYDPLIPGSPGGHNHGWGIAFYNSNNLFYYRSGNPMYTEPKMVELITSMSGSGHGIVHIRRAGPNEPLGLVHAHPYVAQVNDTILFLAHNGGLFKEKLAGIVGYRGNLDKITDTFLYFKLLISKVSETSHGDIVEGIISTVEELVTRDLVKVKDARGRIKDSTLNSLILVVGNDGSRVFALEDWEHISDERRREYYAIYYSRYSDIIVAASSTIHKWLISEGFKTWKPRALLEKYVDEHKIRIIEL